MKKCYNYTKNSDFNFTWYIFVKNEKPIYNGLYYTYLVSKESFLIKSKKKIKLNELKFVPLKIYKDKKGEYVKRYPFGNFYINM